MTPCGLLHDPESGSTRRVPLEWGGAAGAVGLRAGGRAVPLEALALSGGGWNGEAIHLAWSAGGRSWSLTIEDAAVAEALAEALPGPLAADLRRRAGASRRAARRGGLTYTVVGLVVLLPLLLLLVLFLMRDRLLSAALGRLPSSVDARIGDLVHERLTASGSLVVSGPAVEAVRSMGARILAAAPPHRFRFRFEVARDGTVNAYAAPGGLVVVHAGLLEAAASPDEAAGVLAHEVTHVLQRHSMRQLVFEAGLVAAGRLLLGAPEGAAEVLTRAGLDLTSLRFSRDQERDADLGGLALLEGARLPADGLIRFFDRLGREAAPPPLLSSHPPGEDRAARLTAEARRRGAWTTEPLPLDWAAVQAQARGAR